MGIWDMTRAEREQLAEKLSALPDDAWDSETLCEGWRVRDAVGHMIAIGTMSAAGFLGGMVRNRLSFERLQAEGIRANTIGRSPSQILGGFRATVSSHAKPPGPPTSVLGEMLVHGEDIFRVQDGRFAEHPIEHVVTVADFYKRNNFPLKVKRRIAGVTLRMTDSDWSYGSGPEVTGLGISLLMAMVGRTIALDDLKGEGVALLSTRS
jgi:uncharacterized protein (TIGR03083 family)